MATDTHTDQANWKRAYQLLQSGKYEQAAEILRTTESATLHTGHPLIAMTAGASRQICLALIAYRAEIEWHQLARGNAELRERTLSQHLLSMLALVDEQPHDQLANPLIEARLDPPYGHRHNMEKRVSLWRRIRNFFDRQYSPTWPPLENRTMLSPAEKRLLTPTNEAAPPQQIVEQIDEQIVEQIIEQIDEQVPTPAPPIEQPMVEVAPSTEDTTKPVSDFKVLEDETPTPPTPIQSLPVDEEIEPLLLSPTEVPEPDDQNSPLLAVYCLGTFRVYQDEQPVEEWPSSKGLSIFKYLSTHRERPIAKEVLMDLFWPDAAPDAARNNLNVAIYGLRRALRKSHPDFSHVLFQNDFYLLNPELRIWLDVDDFTKHVTTGRQWEQVDELAQAIQAYRAAETLYQGEFLAEDRYEDWPLPQRQSMQDDYLSILNRLSDYYLEQKDLDDCMLMSEKMLAVDSCREDAHRRLMRCYCQQGQLPLALRQYHLCVDALARELDVEPSPETEELYEQIRRRQPL